VLSKAGLVRLGWSQKITEALSTDISLPAVGQGAIAIESRVKDLEATEILGKLDDEETRTVIIAERALLAALQGGCQVPVGAWARMERGELVMEAMVCSMDGVHYVRQKSMAPPSEAVDLGQRMAQLLIDGGARVILDEVNRARG
jgi:hydroxymethylbilane synthase